MALSLPGERSNVAAASANPLVAILRWVARVQATQARRTALSALLELDRAGLNDLGISRDDVALAMSAPNQAGRMLHAVRARNARA